MNTRHLLLAVLVVFFGTTVCAQERMTVRIKDVAYLQGIRENQLVGFGLVTGLDGNGDSANSSLLKSTLSSLLSSFSVSVPSDELRSRNTAVVMVTADIPAFVRPGDRITVHVSSVGDARSLRGGVLLQTPLRASNGSTYAVAQGQIGGIAIEGSPETVSTIPGGAIVEREVISTYVENDRVSILLRNPDFTTASRIADMLREQYPDQVVNAIDASMIQISLPIEIESDPVRFISEVEELEIVPDTSARVVVNPRSGIVVVGRNVRIGQVAVTFRGAKIELGVQRSRSDSSANTNLLVLPDVPTVEDLVRLLQEAGLDTDNIIEILKAIEQAGALYGRLIIM